LSLSVSEKSTYPPKRIIQYEENSAIVVLDQQTYTKRIRDVLSGNEARGIFSVTERNDNPEMFSHYANNGNGICVGFAWEEMNLSYDGIDPPSKTDT